MLGLQDTPGSKVKGGYQYREEKQGGAQRYSNLSGKGKADRYSNASGGRMMGLGGVNEPTFGERVTVGANDGQVINKEY